MLPSKALKQWVPESDRKLFVVNDLEHTISCRACGTSAQPAPLGDMLRHCSGVRHLSRVNSYSKSIEGSNNIAELLKNAGLVGSGTISAKNMKVDRVTCLRNMFKFGISISKVRKFYNFCFVYYIIPP